MKKILFSIIAVLCLATSYAQQEKYEVQRKDNSVILLRTTPQGSEEIPVTSESLENDYKAAQQDIDQLVEKRKRLQELVDLDKQIELAKGVQSLRYQLIPKVKEMEAKIASEAPKPKN